MTASTARSRQRRTVDRATDAVPRAHVDDTIAALERRGSVKWTLHPGTIGAAVAESDLGVAPAVRRAFGRVAASGAIGYLPSAAARDVADATARWYARTAGWSIDPAQVRLVPDVVTAFEVTLSRLMRRDDTAVIVPTPAYRQFLTLPPALGREVIELPLVERDGRLVIDPDDLARAFAAGGELLVLCNPHNPTGQVATADELRAIAEVVDAHGGRVFVDEIHSPLLYAGGRHVPYASVSDAAASHAVTAFSPSKGWNVPAAGCAQVILTDPDDRDRWRSVGARAAHAVSAFGVAGAIAAYTETDAWLEATVSQLDTTRRLLHDRLGARLPGVRMRLPEAGYLGYLDLRDVIGDVDTDLAAWFRTHARVSLSDGREGGVVGQGFVRVVFATPPGVVAEMVERMARALAEGQEP